MSSEKTLRSQSIHSSSSHHDSDLESGDEQEMREFREDMRQEALEEQYYERKMWNSLDYALEVVCEDAIEEILEQLEAMSKSLESYGHQLSVKDILSHYV